MEGKLYETVNGVKTLILWQGKRKKQSDICGFCKKTHFHGYKEGHKTADCGFEGKRVGNKLIQVDHEDIPLPNGEFLRRIDGYIIRLY